MRRPAVLPRSRPARLGGPSGRGRGPAGLPSSRRLAAEIDRLRAELAESRRRVALLEALCETDPLCGVLNRRGFERELARALAHLDRYGGCLALAYIDLDGFKLVNDRLGHAAGDRLLAAAAETLAGAVRASDRVARIGGDEFSIILHNISSLDANIKAVSLEERLAARLAALGLGVPVGASCGVALAGPGDTVAGLMARADAAMYARKQARKEVSAAERRDGAAQAMMSGVSTSSR